MSNGSRFSGRVALVTGGASGMGEAVIRQLLAEDASVACFDLDGAVPPGGFV